MSLTIIPIIQEQQRIKKMYCEHSILNIQYKSFSRFGVRVWNAIPQDSKSLSKKTFKKKIKNQLLQYINSNGTHQESEKLVVAFSS